MLVALAACGDNTQPLSVYVVTGETVWFHPSNPIAARTIQKEGRLRGWTVQVSSDAAELTPELLEQTDVIVFAVTSGNILDTATRELLEPYFAAGGGFVGIHSASFTEFDWSFYRLKLLPVSFKAHPAPEIGAPSNVLQGALTLEDDDDPLVAGVPDPWIRSDEFYTFNERPEEIAGVRVLVALDEDSMGTDYPAFVRVGYHPIAFVHENEGMRVFYTALGHTDDSYAEPAFVRMLSQGIEWAGSRHYALKSTNDH